MILMDASKFAAWKYKHEGKGFRSPKQKIAALSLFVAAILVYYGFHFLPLSIGLCVIAAVILLYTSHKIFVGPRYLICGSSILYYNNIVRMSLDEASGKLLLVTASNQNFTLQRENFPTNARKDEKIRKNKAAKFTKVSQSIIGKVQRLSPDVETGGITGQPAG
jgi:hypothetical protein